MGFAYTFQRDAFADLEFSSSAVRGLYRGTLWGSIIGLIDGDTRSLDNGSRSFGFRV